MLDEWEEPGRTLADARSDLMEDAAKLGATHVMVKAEEDGALEAESWRHRSHIRAAVYRCAPPPPKRGIPARVR